MDDFLGIDFFGLVGWLALLVGAMVVILIILMTWTAISDKVQMKKKHHHSAKGDGDSYGYFAPNAVSKMLDVLKRLIARIFGRRERASDSTTGQGIEERDAQEQDAIDLLREILWKLGEVQKALVELVNQNERHQDAVLDALKRPRNLAEEQPRRSVTQQINYQKPQNKPRPEGGISSYHKEPWLDALSSLYNSGIENPDLQSQFKRHYQTIRIGVVNAEQRSRDPNIDPQFREMSAGDYWAVRMDNGQQYAVVLRFNLSIEMANYGPGAIEWAFECLGYVPGKPYRRVRLNRPAIFLREGENWIVSAPGELDFSWG